MVGRAALFELFFDIFDNNSDLFHKRFCQQTALPLQYLKIIGFADK